MLKHQIHITDVLGSVGRNTHVLTRVITCLPSNLQFNLGKEYKLCRRRYGAVPNTSRKSERQNPEKLTIYMNIIHAL